MPEVTESSPIFQLDAVLPKRFSKDQVKTRYVDTDLAKIMRFINETNPVFVRLSIQGEFVEDDPYLLHQVDKVSSSTDTAGQTFFVCECGDKKVCVGGQIDAESMSPLKLIWPRESALMEYGGGRKAFVEQLGA